jgi:hypothetical protein
VYGNEAMSICSLGRFVIDPAKRLLRLGGLCLGRHAAGTPQFVAELRETRPCRG